jgi:hypothetical protein
MRIYVARASKVSAEREDAMNADPDAPEYHEEGYGPPSKDVLDAIPRREG